MMGGDKLLRNVCGCRWYLETVSPPGSWACPGIWRPITGLILLITKVFRPVELVPSCKPIDKRFYSKVTVGQTLHPRLPHTCLYYCHRALTTCDNWWEIKRWQKTDILDHFLSHREIPKARSSHGAHHVGLQFAIAIRRPYSYRNQTPNIASGFNIKPGSVSPSAGIPYLPPSLRNSKRFSKTTLKCFHRRCNIRTHLWWYHLS